MAEGSNTHTLPLSDAAVENANMIKSLTEDSAMLHIQKGMSQLAPPSSANQLHNNEEVIDSALSAAMRDPRERVSLLRLEQVMIDFMNSSDGYLEVGGPYNSVVISPNKTNPDGTLSSMQSSSYTRPATSFQRCLLHRLADRFGILREVGSLMEGSIRLVKQKESKAPKFLLLNHSASVNSTHEGEDYFGMGNGNNTNGWANNNHSNIPMDPWHQSTTSSSTQPNTQVKSSGKSNSKRKMKIMKRSTGADGMKNNGLGNSGNSSGNAQRSRKSKNFSEKEKAYAEARARIFNQENSTSSAQTTSSGARVQGQFQSSSTPAAASVLSYGVNNPGKTYIVPGNNYTVGGYPLAKPSSSSSLVYYPEDENNGVGAGMPAASTGMGVVPTKATWRNRRQEENDPDFQRGTLITQPMAAAVPTTAASLHPSSLNYYTNVGGYQQGNPYHDDAAYYPYPTTNSTVMAASAGRGAAGGRSGRGFNVQNAPRTQYNPYQYPKPGNHQVSDKTSKISCMEEFPKLR